jgi:hypothetical protein
LDEALAAARNLAPEARDEIARLILKLAGGEEPPPVALSADERTALAASKAAAARGEFATDDQVNAVWASTACETPLYSPGSRRS